MARPGRAQSFEKDGNCRFLADNVGEELGTVASV
jgi:hypothetical protein